MLVSCERLDYDEEAQPHTDQPAETDNPSDANVILCFSPEIQVFFASTRAAADISDVATHLNLTVFDSSGTKVRTVAQQRTGESFGTVALTLPSGTYQFVVMAHSCDGNATISSTSKVTFPSNKVTDTFYQKGSFVVSEHPQTHYFTLSRVVSLIRLVFTDAEMPSTVSQFKFYYLGGSSTFSPATALGSVNSRQTELRPFSPDNTYDLYTFPHTENDELTRLTVTALDASGNTLHERTFQGIPILRNQITLYTGSFFTEAPFTVSTTTF